MQRYSKQRESILTFLQSTKTHPTAEQIYNYIKKEIPNISLGTIYRNLNELTQKQQILKITTKDGIDRYDGTIKKHYHFICNKCKNITDLNISLNQNIEQEANKTLDAIILDHEINFQGICKNCQS